MSRVRLSVTLALSDVAAGVIVAAIAISLTDSAGAAHTRAIDPSTLTNDGTGRTLVTVDFEDGEIPAGDFSGSVQATDADNANVGDPQTFSGTIGGATGGQQWIPVSVSASVS